MRKILGTYVFLGLSTSLVNYGLIKSNHKMRRSQALDGLNYGKDCSRYYDLNKEHCDKLRSSLSQPLRINYGKIALNGLIFPIKWSQWYFDEDVRRQDLKTDNYD